ncbi:IS6 family transposase [Bacillus thuringiensis]|uniref:DDE domain-containing protein n=1 Tax=Bacillus thuringiensis Bt18247 TaxID=1423143 RepID=A0A9W3SZH3_BACTU|nr:IS6 family transposase [Bacillus thuringiensis]AOM14308.1 hypothetical protein BTI247_59780 [Bacillus thuringiensis Bt18247]
MRYFKGKQFKKDIILIAVGYYCRFSLSYRDVSEILKERGVSVHPTTIMRWVREYGNLIYQIWKKKNKSAHLTWHLDETYIQVKGEWRYLYCTIDQEGYTLDIQLRKTRDYQAAYMFMKRLVNAFGEPTVLTTDKAPALLCAFKKLQKNNFYMHTKHSARFSYHKRNRNDSRRKDEVFQKASSFRRSMTYKN